MPSAASGYRALLRTPGAAAFFLTASVGRVGIAMTGLGLVWLLHARTGSYGTAGLATAGFALAEALIGPQVARLIDRFGQGRVLPFSLLAHAAGIAGVFASTSTAAAVAAATFAGAAVPQLGALSAARWSHLLRAERPGELPAAFSLESLANATGFLVGPVLVTALGAVGDTTTASALAVTLILGGGAALAAQRRTEPPPAMAHPQGAAPAGDGSHVQGAASLRDGSDLQGAAPAGDGSHVQGAALAGDGAHLRGAAPPKERAARRGSAQAGGPPRGAYGRPGRTLLRPAFLLLAALNLAVGLYFGTVAVSVSAFAVGHDTPGAAAPITAAAGLSGLLSGWLYGLRRHRAPARRQLVVTTAWLTAAGLLLPFAPSALWLGAAMMATEAAVPPTLVLLNVLTEEAAHRAVLTEAFTWNNSASAAGSALAAPLAGRAADGLGASAALALAPVAGLLLLALALALPLADPPRAGASGTRYASGGSADRTAA